MPAPTASANRRRPAPLPAALCAAALFLLNAYFCRELFGLNFSSHLESIESAYISISRWALDNWHDLTWFPLWYGGMPFHRVYQPGLHLSVALLAQVAGWTAPHAYHFLTALAYCAAPVALFYLCYRTTGSWAFGLLAGALNSLISAVSVLSPEVSADIGGMLLPRRYQVLVHYGEGPHLTAVALIPLVILVLDGALAARRRIFVFLAPAALAAVLLTNWPGSMGLAMAVAAYLLSRLSTKRLFDLPAIHLPVVLGIGTIAYLLTAVWIPPSILRTVVGNAQQSDASYFGSRQLLPALLLAVVLAALLWVFARRRVDPWARFFVYFAAITGIPVLTRHWFDWKLVPQANRFEVEFDMAVAGAVAYVLVAGYRKLPRRAQIIAMGVALLLAIAQARHYRRYARENTHAIDMAKTIEYRMSKWFDAHMNGASVYAPGNVSLWMNMFTDTPQLIGCCDQGVPHYAYRILSYTVYTGQVMGEREGPDSVLWLRAYGARAVGVSGPDSTNAFHPYSTPRKFEGLLPVLWREGDDVVYRIPAKAPDPVRVIPRSAVVTRTPISGLDIKSIATLADALEDASLPAASFHWANRHEALIDAETRPGEVIFLQISYDRGWRAEQAGVALPVHPDGLGMMYVEPASPGRTQIRLVYDGGAERELSWILFACGLLGWAALVVYWPQRSGGPAR